MENEERKLEICDTKFFNSEMEETLIDIVLTDNLEKMTHANEEFLKRIKLSKEKNEKKPRTFETKSAASTEVKQVYTATVISLLTISFISW